MILYILFIYLPTARNGHMKILLTIKQYNIMKKLQLMVVAMLLVLSGSVASAQQSKSDETLEFRPHWNVGVQGGAAYTIGETSDFGKLISPATALNVQWQFHHAFGLRLGLGGWQAKGAVVLPEQFIYPFRFAQLSADVVMDLTSLIGGFNHKRLCSAYVFAGLGAAYGYDNSTAAPKAAYFSNYWEQRFFVPGRVGLGVDFRLSDVVSLGLEGNTMIFDDTFNSKAQADSPADWHFNVLAGLKFNLGKNTRPSKAYADKLAAEEAAEAARLAAEKAAAEKAAAEKAAAEKAAAEKAARERAEAARLAAEKAAAEKAAAERAALARQNSKNIHFSLGSSHIGKKADADIVILADWLKAHPDFSLALVGYADKGTGTAKANMEVSKKRIAAVIARLEKLGLEKSRITTDYKGDTVQPFAENDMNRVVTCTVLP